MFRINRRKGALLAPPLAVARDRDNQEVSSYVLTDAGLAKYTNATKNLAALPARPQGDCDEDDSTDSQSLDQVIAKLNAVPGAYNAHPGSHTNQQWVST